MPDFYVELPMQVSGADSPEQAVEAFIEQIVTYGHRTWTYLVTDDEGNTVKVEKPQPRNLVQNAEEADEPRPEQPATEPE